MAEEKEKPLTRKDVLRLIKENGGTAKGLDLSGRNLEGIDLSNLNLGGVILQDAFLPEANFQGALLPNSDLRGAFLVSANLRDASLWGADLGGAFLSHADLQDAFLDEIKWGPKYIMGEENASDFIHAKEVYRILKKAHQQAGMYDLAGEFYFREMTIRRRALRWWPNPLSRIRQTLYWLLCGYGERPWRVVIWGISVLFGLALLYFLLRGVAPYTFTLQAFSSSLYYSAVSFTALGYGPWFSASSVRSWVQGVGAAEAIVGVFTIALFLITFVRKMTR
jgi:hypothetical protein